MKKPVTRGPRSCPGAGELRRYWLELRAAADAGDVGAIVALIALAEKRPLIFSIGATQAGAGNA